MIRPRRLRRNSALRDLVQENHLLKSDFIYPMFIIEGSAVKTAVESMPGIERFSIDLLLEEIKSVVDLGIRAVALFPVIEESKKTLAAEESYNPEGLTQRAVKAIKKQFPDLMIMTDIALDPYTSHGHDGILRTDNAGNTVIDNDETVEILVKMALAQAEAGADIVAPSDMMDGRIGAIRDSLDLHGFTEVSIMAYTAKYASCLYGPFRDALGSLGAKENQHKAADIPKDKKTYQMNPANSVEAVKELELDLIEAADFLMVKPASWYLDIISKFKDNSTVPVAAYQVSGEYSMIHAAAKAGYIDLDQAMHESLISIKRAGADIILSYFAKDICKSL